MMKVNWTVRFKNPIFWVQIAAAVFLPILAYFGLSWEDMTSFGAVWDVLAQAVTNPALLATVAVSVWNAVNDPTTAGIRDSERAMTYREPYKDGERV